jgi:transcriptional regulator NrdR family protein
MKCPKCNALGLAAADSRPYNGTIRRRRKCLNCGYRFSTFEIIEEDYRKMKDTEAELAYVLSYLEVFLEKVNERRKDNG